MREFLRQNRYKLLGGIGGLLLALILIFLWPLFIILLFIGMGVFLGGILDTGKKAIDWAKGLFPLSRKDESKKS